MLNKPTPTQRISIALIFTLLHIVSLTAVIDAAAIAKPATTSFTQPTFNFDFSSLTNRKSAQDAMAQTRSNWGNFFVEKPKPIFSE